MLGAIVGDIVGSRFEFYPTQETDFDLFHPDCRVTDDTVLTLATACALLDQRPFADCYREFYRHYPDVGYGARFSAWAQSSDCSAYNSYGNGSAMRVSPVAWFAANLEQALELASRSAEATHNHPEGLKGAKAVAQAIFMARSGEGKVAIRRRIEADFGYDLQRSIAAIKPTYRFEVSCQKSVPEALLCFLESTDFESALRLAVSLGGDADTQAAIAGSVAEAFYGGVPAVILKDILRFFDPFQLEICQRFAVQYNPTLSVRRLGEDVIFC